MGGHGPPPGCLGAGPPRYLNQSPPIPNPSPRRALRDARAGRDRGVARRGGAPRRRQVHRLRRRHEQRAGEGARRQHVGDPRPDERHRPDHAEGQGHRVQPDERHQPGRDRPGPDGNLWTVSGQNVIRIPAANPAGSTSFSVLVAGRDIDAGKDGLLWVADFGSQVVSLTTDGDATAYSTGNNSGLQAIAAGPKGQVAYADPISNPQKVGPDHDRGKAKKTAAPRDPFGVAFGADKAYWIPRFAAGDLVRLTTDGRLSTLGGLGQNAWPASGSPRAPTTPSRSRSTARTRSAPGRAGSARRSPAPNTDHPAEKGPCFGGALSAIPHAEHIARQAGAEPPSPRPAQAPAERRRGRPARHRSGGSSSSTRTWLERCGRAESPVSAQASSAAQRHRSQPLAKLRRQASKSPTSSIELRGLASRPFRFAFAHRSMGTRRRAPAFRPSSRLSRRSSSASSTTVGPSVIRPAVEHARGDELVAAELLRLLRGREFDLHEDRVRVLDVSEPAGRRPRSAGPPACPRRTAASRPS